jgi:large subunit ribosomal protein L18
MESELIKRNRSRKRKVLRIRKKLKGSSLKPRLSIHKSNMHISVQLIDDEKQITLAAVSTNSKDSKSKKSKASAAELGNKIAEIAKKQNIKDVVFDRGRCKYHGLVAELADGARKAGLKF